MLKRCFISFYKYFLTDLLLIVLASENTAKNFYNSLILAFPKCNNYHKKSTFYKEIEQMAIFTVA